MRDLEDMLRSTDFSRESANRDAIKQRLLSGIHENQNMTGEMDMKKRSIKPVFIIAATIALTLAFTIVANAETIMGIIGQFTLGEHAKYSVTDDREPSREIPAQIQGQLFDAEGTELTEFPEDASEIYDANGERAMTITGVNEDGSMFKVDVTPSGGTKQEYESAHSTYFDTFDDVKPWLAFDLLAPGVLPDGFAIDRIFLYNGENGETAPLGENKYLSVYYKNTDKTQEIYLQVRLMDAETGFEAGASPEMREITINGNPGVLDGKHLDVEIDGVMYMIMANSCESVTQADVIAMAESLK